MNCRYCDTEHDAERDGRFCAQCGMSVEPPPPKTDPNIVVPESIRCPACGVSTGPEVEKCPSCGTRLHGRPPPST